MKTIIFLLLISISTFGQKYENYKTLKDVGTTVGILGTGIVMVGAFLTIQGENKLQSGIPDDIVQGASQYSIGTDLLLGGLATFVTGIVLHSVGNKKMKQYSLGLNLNKGIGLTLCYEFR